MLGWQNNSPFRYTVKLNLKKYISSASSQPFEHAQFLHITKVSWTWCISVNFTNQKNVYYKFATDSFQLVNFWINSIKFILKFYLKISTLWPKSSLLTKPMYSYNLLSSEFIEFHDHCDNMEFSNFDECKEF